MWFEETDGLEVDPAKAWEVVDHYCTSPLAIQSRSHSAMESARFWLNQEVLTLPAGMAGKYQHMAKRGQYFAHLAERLNITPAEMDAHLLTHAISDQEHAALQAEHHNSTAPQLELFAA